MAETRQQRKINFAVLRAVLGAFYGSVLGYASARKRLLGCLWIRQRTLHMGGKALTILEGGESGYRTPVLCLHGAAGNAVDWGWLLKHATDHYQIVAIDRPGYGPTEDISPLLTQDVKFLEDALVAYASENKEGKVILLGRATGAGLAAWLAAARPDLVQAVVLVNPYLKAEALQISSLQTLFAKKGLSWLLPKALRQGNREMLQYPSFLETLEPQLDKITSPVTVIHSATDRLVEPANAAYIKKACTAAEKLNIITLNSGGHFLNKTKPRRILEALESL